KRRTALQRIDQSLAALDAKAARQRQAVKELDRQIAMIHSLASAKLNNRWWTGTWWRALFRGDVVGQQNTLEAQRQGIQADLQELGATEERLRREPQCVEETYQVERQRLVTAGVSRRNAELDTFDVALLAQASRLDAEWQRLLAELDPDSPRPEAATPEAVRAAAQAAQQNLQQDQVELEFARQWAACPAQPAEFWLERLRHCVNLVPATTASINT